MSIKVVLARIVYYFILLSTVLKAAAEKHKYKDKFKFMLLTPAHANLGDHAIAKAEYELLKDYHIFEITEARLVRILKYKCFPKTLKFLFGDYDIYIHGGGFIGTLWKYSDDMALDIIENQHNNKIVIFPQTIFYDDNEQGYEWLEKAKSIYSKHPDLTIFTRENFSYEIGKQLCPNTYLIPDVVLYMDECKGKRKREGALISLRADSERTMSEEMQNEVLAKVDSLFNKKIFADMQIDHNINPKDRDRYLTEQFNKFKCAEFVITDRLHATIFSAITATPCAVFKSKSHKLKGIYELFLKDFEYIKMVSSVQEIEDFYNEIKGKTFVYDKSKLVPYYEKLLKIIK